MSSAVMASDFELVRSLVHRASSIVLEPGKEYLVESRLTPLVRERNLNSIGQLMDAIRRGDRQLEDQVVELMTTNETSFFRDQHPFELLKLDILPELIKTRRSIKRLRIWSAACSSGQEPYSIAILLREFFPELGNWRVEILATDLSGRMLEKGRNGRYSDLEVNRGLPARLMVKYFKREGVYWTISPELRKLVDFRRHNLQNPCSDRGQFDLILLRNVLIYFDSQSKEKVLAHMARALSSDGSLVAGGSETFMGLQQPFSCHRMGRSLVYRKEN